MVEAPAGLPLCRIAERDDGAIDDTLLWDSITEVEVLMHRQMDELRNLPVHTMIDQSTMSWMVSTAWHFFGSRG